MFVTGIGMSQIAPVLPLYVKDLGISDVSSIGQISGIAFGVTFIVSAIFSPVWGWASDKYGLKPMLLRASLGMAFVIFSIGFAANAWQLIGLRALQGAMTGYSTACMILIATQVDRGHVGWALGTLSTSSVAGSLIGPLIGGFLADNLGLRYVFFITAALLLVAFVSTLVFVQESSIRGGKKTPGIIASWRLVPNKDLLVTMFVTSFVLMVALFSIEPIVTIYVGQLSGNIGQIALVSGLAFSASGLGNIIAAPRLGSLSDMIGPQKVLFFALAVAGIVFIPQAFVNDAWQLIGLRFLLGLALGGLTPSVNTLIKKITPGPLTGGIYGFNISAQHLGVFAGAVLGGQVSAYLGIREVFIITSALLVMNAVWVYFKVYHRSLGPDPNALKPLPPGRDDGN
jgi:MFS transporter, DHA1 family, multidrug resistance protein